MNPMNGVALSRMDYLDVKNLARTGEGTFLEFKRSVPRTEKIAREMAAFANYKGGTLLVGVDDDKSLVGVENYREEQYILNKAAGKFCTPKVDISIEIVYFGDRDLMVVKIPEAQKKPVYVHSRKGKVVYVRRKDESRAVSKERIHILENRAAGKEITFEYGPDEQRLFRYLNEYSEISVEKYAHIIDRNEQAASTILVQLASAGILQLFTKDNIDYFSFSYRCK